MLYDASCQLGAGLSASRRAWERVSLHELSKTHNKQNLTIMKKTIIALLALMPLAQGAELVADLRLDGDFSDAKGNLTFANKDSRYNGDTYWLTDTAVNDSTKYVSVGGDAAAWNGTFAANTAPSTTNFAITLFINASAFPVGNNAEHPDWTAQWVFGGGASSNGLPKVGIGADGQIKVSCHNVGGGINSGAENVITTNKWYQVGVSLTDVVSTVQGETATPMSVWTLYINGESVASSTVQTPSNITWTTVSLFEGKDATSSGRFSGFVDDIQIYNVSSLEDASTVMSVQAARLVPEPTTATLSLLALAGLAARRRRK